MATTLNAADGGRVQGSIACKQSPSRATSQGLATGITGIMPCRDRNHREV